MMTLNYKKVNNEILTFDYKSKRSKINMLQIIDQIDLLFLQRDKIVQGYICILDGFDIIVSKSSLRIQGYLNGIAKKDVPSCVFNRIDLFEVDDLTKWVSYLNNENIFKSDMLSPTPNKAISFHNQSDLDKIKIEDLDLSVSVYNAFKAAKINTLYDATQKTAEDLMSIRSFGKKALRDVQLLLSAYSLTLKQ
jgi:hypothetical protein